jgi:thermostable 8-oxoguanine DNA glycosylase
LYDWFEPLLMLFVQHSLSAMGSALVESTVVKRTRGKNDLAWQYNHVKDLNNTNKVTCNFCLLTSSGGITRAWKHQLGISGQAACSKTPEDVKVLLQADLDRKKRKKQVLKELRAQVDDVVRHDAAELQRTQNGKRPAEPSLQAAKKKKGLMDY